MFQFLLRKWRGSHEAMWAFVDELVAQAPAGSPIHGLVAEAHAEYWLDHLDLGDPAVADNYFDQPDVHRSVVDAYGRWTSGPREEGNTRVVVENDFAFMAAYCGLRDIANETLGYLDGRMTLTPWSWMKEPEEAYADALRFAELIE